MSDKNKFTVCSDEELMFHIEKGEERAFDELYGRYSKNLMSYLLRMLNRDKALAEDLLQDVFMKIASHPEKFDRQRSFRTWIFCVASNACKNHFRHEKTVRESHSEIRSVSGEADEHTLKKIIAGMDARSFRKMLDETLDEMAPEKKEAFILKYQEEKTIAEIAFIQECPEGSVKSRLHYCVKVLEEKLKIFKPN
jgi:RNA polymerase sigma-70 factor (ECF subfamily)